MAKKQRRKRRRVRRSPIPEDRRAEVVTVMWMLAMMATLGAELVGGVLRLLLNGEESGAGLRIIPNLMLFTAAVTGLICLALTPLVYRFRRSPPPMTVTVLAVTISAIPLAIGVLQSLH